MWEGFIIGTFRRIAFFTILCIIMASSNLYAAVHSEYNAPDINSLTSGTSLNQQGRDMLLGLLDMVLNNLSIGGNNTEMRDLLDKINSEWSMPDNYVMESNFIGNMKTEWLHEVNIVPDKVILHLHGGAYIRDLDYNGNLYRRMAVQYAQISGAGVLTIDYRIAPKDPYPAALEDALAAYTWLLNQGYDSEDIIIAGDSAGGGLALATTLYLKDNDMPLPLAVITMSAWTDLDYANINIAYVGNDNDATNPYISPAYGDYIGFPPLLMQVGTRDIITDTLSVSNIANDAGVSVKQTTYQGMFHVFQALFPSLEEARDAWAEVKEFIKYVYEESN